MAAPTDFSKAWWQKNKPVTLKSTGFGKALEDFTKSEALVWSKANIKAKIAALKAIEAARVAAVGKCNKTLHADALKYLEAYKTLIAKAGQALQRDGEHYDKLVTEWHKKRSDVLAEMKIRDKEWTALAPKLDKVLLECGMAAMGQDAQAKAAAKTKLAKAKDLVAKQKQLTIDTCDKNRFQSVLDTSKMNVFGADKDETDYLAIVKLQAVNDGEAMKYEGLIKECEKKLG